jgi:predicted lipoprotein with Yx(FWY)xxD motif
MTRNPRHVLLALSLGAVVSLAACGSSGSSKAAGDVTTSGRDATTTTSSGGYSYGGSGSSTSTPPTTAAPAAASAVVNVVTTKLGLTLVDASGKTLYEYKPDPAGSSTCTGGCAQAWPPLTTTAATVAVGKGLTASLFTTVAGEAGAKVVAVDGHALYRFSGDTKPGDTNGQGFGGVWHAAGPLGNTM